MKFESWYDKNYRKLLIIPAVILALAIVYIGVFYVQTGSVIHKDVTLTGGTEITIQTNASVQELKSALSPSLKDFAVKAISDNAGNQIQLIVTVKGGNGQVLKNSLENFLGYNLTSENSSQETTSASLSEEFYKQLIVAVLLAFFWMAVIVFLIFSKGWKAKFWAVVLNIFLGFFLGKLFLRLNPVVSLVIFLAFAVMLIYIYIKNSVPSFAVMLSAFADIVVTLAIVDLVGMKISTAGIVAFLMIIGYSVDTDILLTTRLLQRKESVNKTLFRAFKTGTMMTSTSIIAIASALFVVYSFSSVLNQIFIILLIGLGLDLINTWVANASIIKWYVEKK